MAGTTTVIESAAGQHAETIRVFLRVRPSPEDPEARHVELGTDTQVAVFRRPEASRVSEHLSEQYAFTFHQLFGGRTSQEEVFQHLAEPVVRSALQGVNGTIFAYGQTGSGKTHTLSGSPESFEERGVLPRAIALIFAEVAACSRRKYSVHISYVEVYNEVGYDLLDTERDVRALADLPQVSVLEGPEGVFQCRNLSRHWVSSAEDAFNLLFLGATNRTISETPMNLASSRSHCIFTAYIESQEAGTDTIRTSKLSLVDLAGSERVYRTRVDGITLHEAKHINLSLHHLEQVIAALQAHLGNSPDGHVPYRNSLLTMLLRDCIGGQCRTCMVANVTSAPSQFEETISTCRFAQRVACIPYKAVVNEHVSPELLIARLQRQVAGLQLELRWGVIRQLKGEDAGLEKAVSDEDQHEYQAQLLQYLRQASEAEPPPLPWHSQLLPRALQHLRPLWQQHLAEPPAPAVQLRETASCADGLTAVASSSAAAECCRQELDQSTQRLEVELLEQRAAAQRLVCEVNGAQARLQGLRAAVEKRRLQAYLAAGHAAASRAEPPAVLLDLEQIEEVKAQYRDLLSRLNASKAGVGFLEQRLGRALVT